MVVMGEIIFWCFNRFTKLCVFLKRQDLFAVQVNVLGTRGWKWRLMRAKTDSTARFLIWLVAFGVEYGQGSGFWIQRTLQIFVFIFGSAALIVGDWLKV